MGVTKAIYSVPLFSDFFTIIKTHVSYSISRLYLTGVASSRPRWHLSNINVTGTFKRSEILLTEKLTNGVLVIPTSVLVHINGYKVQPSDCAKLAGTHMVDLLRLLTTPLFLFSGNGPNKCCKHEIKILSRYCDVKLNDFLQYIHRIKPVIQFYRCLGKASGLSMFK